MVGWGNRETQHLCTFLGCCYKVLYPGGYGADRRVLSAPTGPWAPGQAPMGLSRVKGSLSSLHHYSTLASRVDSALCGEQWGRAYIQQDHARLPRAWGSEPALSGPTAQSHATHPGQLLLIGLGWLLLGMPLLLVMEDSLGHLILRLTI